MAKAAKPNQAGYPPSSRGRALELSQPSRLPHLAWTAAPARSARTPTATISSGPLASPQEPASGPSGKPSKNNSTTTKADTMTPHSWRRCSSLVLTGRAAPPVGSGSLHRPPIKSSQRAAARSRVSQPHEPSSTRRRKAARDLRRLSDASAARSGSHAKRANATIRVTYSGPTDLPLPSLGVIPRRISARRDLLQTSINRRFGASNESGSVGNCLSATPNSRANPSRSARSQLSTARTGTRRATRRASGCRPRRFGTSSAGQGASWSRSRRINQFTCSPERLNSGIRGSRFGAPGPVTTA